MRLLALERSPRAYRIDFACYAATSSTLALTVVVAAPLGQGASLALWGMAGAMGWTLVKRCHALHHRRTDGSPGHYGVTQGWWDALFGTGYSAPAVR